MSQGREDEEEAVAWCCGDDAGGDGGGGDRHASVGCGRMMMTMVTVVTVRQGGWSK